MILSVRLHQKTTWCSAALIGALPQAAQVAASNPYEDPVLCNLHTKFVAVLIGCLPLGAISQETEGPSFDCRKARSTPEKIICSDADLARMDRELADLYRAAKSSARDPQEFQKNSAQEWRIREETCRDRACLVQWYEKRKLQLAAAVNPSISTVNRQAAVSPPAPVPLAVVSAQPTPMRAPEVAAPKPVAVSPTPASVPATASAGTDDPTKLAAMLVAKKQEYAAARAMMSIGGTVSLTPTLEGMMGTDNFGEKPWCLVSFEGRGPEAAKGVGKWRLVYRREKAKGEDIVFTGSWEGSSAPPRVSFDDDSSFINAPDAMLSIASPEFSKRLATAKTVTFKHTGTIAFTYDAQQLRLAQSVARKACP